jgi:hypothetical protein
MFRPLAQDIIHLQGNGGVPFTAFVDGLIRVHAVARHGLLDSDVRTNIRVNIADGGVDTTVGHGITEDPTGWFTGGPTVWQYKGTSYSGTSVAGLLNGSAVRERIVAGDAFRLAIADGMPDPTKREWEETLTAASRAINPAAPEAKVLTADDLAAFAARYPALVLAFFSPTLDRHVLHLEAWSANIESNTPEFIEIPSWSVVRHVLEQHIDLLRPAVTAVRTLQGEAGVGKTRLTHEVVCTIPGATALVLYAIEKNAVDVAYFLANDNAVHAVLIADECSPEARSRIESLLVGHRDRVRVIAIDNTGVRITSAEPELLLQRMPDASLEAILAANFGHIPDVRRRAYASLAQGFPRLAAELCMSDAMIADAGHVGHVIPRIGEYLHDRLRPEQLDALAALALVTKMGFSGEVKGELDILCGFLGMERRVVEQSLHDIHDGPGFVARAGRFFYVTPEIVAQAAHEIAWRKWGRVPETFLAEVPEAITQSFLDRSWRSGSEEVRRVSAEYFRGWADALAPEQLRDVATVRKLVALTDTKPEEYLPRVRRLIERSTRDLLETVTGGGVGDGSWGPRRELVWLAERLAQFPEFFSDAERVLLSLAVAEAEPEISNNATGIWIQLFRIRLSGTAVQFSDRIGVLRTRLTSENPQVRAVAANALKTIFEYHATRMLGPATVAGRIPPAEWAPSSAAEEREALATAVALLMESTSFHSDVRDAAVDTATKHARTLIARGFLAELKEMISGIELSDDELSELIEAIDATLVYEYDDEDAPRARGRFSNQHPERNQLTQWRDSLVSGSFHTRLVALVGKDRWAASRLHDEVRGDTLNERSAYQTAIDDLASALLRDQAGLEEAIPWLNSNAARSAEEFGVAIGSHDASGAFLETILLRAIDAESRAFSSGYLRGLLSNFPQYTATALALLDRIEESSPGVAAELAIAGQGIGAFDRVKRLYLAEKIPATYLAERNFLSGPLPDETFSSLLSTLTDAAVGGDREAHRTAIDSLAARVSYRPGREPLRLFTENPEIVENAWRLVEATPAGEPPVSRWWSQVLIALGRINAGRAAQRIVPLLVVGEMRTRDEARRALVAIAETHPEEAMAALGPVILDSEHGWRFLIGNERELFGAFPDDVIREWIRSVGVEGSRRIARHLPAPHLDESGTAVLPPLTEWVLREFESDEETFTQFCLGLHSFQIYSGDIAAEHEAEASTARAFLDHPLKRVREWASFEERQATEDAKRWRQREAERDLV